MIKVNLIPTKKKKKQKPIPVFLIYTILLFVVTGLILGYLAYFYSSSLSKREAKVKENEIKITELKAKIKAVEDFERLNKTFQQRKDIIEELGRNKSLPVKILDEISAQLPVGVWLTAMDIKGIDINLSCTAFAARHGDGLGGDRPREGVGPLEQVGEAAPADRPRRGRGDL